MTKTNYEMFGDLAIEFKDDAFKILLFPCNQFLSQEPSAPTPTTLRRLSTEKLDMEASNTTTLFEMVDVNGKKTHPVFQFLRYNSDLYNEATHINKPIPWNFGKFLVDMKGGVFKFYPAPATADQIKEDIRSLLCPTSPGSPTRRPSIILDEGK